MALDRADAVTGSPRSSRPAPAERSVLPFPLVQQADVGRDGDGSALWRTLRLAAADATARLHPEVARHGVTTFDLEACIAAMCAAIRQSIRGRAPRLRDVPATIPAHRCVDVLRRAFLVRSREIGAEVDPDALLGVLVAFEAVQQQIEADSAQRVIAQLSGKNALELLVEVVHDMRSPLSSILFLVETLRKAHSGPVNLVQERQLGLVYNAAFSLSSMTSDLTELARGCDRLVDAQPTPFSVAEVFRDVGAIVQPIAEEKKLTVELRALESSPRLGHGAALHRVLLNLTTNALKFTSEGKVEVEARPLGRKAIEFSVRDTGRGIPPAVMATLFDTFRDRQRDASFAFSSAGLGLAICRKLVEAMGGELAVQSEVGVGTRFSFALELPPARPSGPIMSI